MVAADDGIHRVEHREVDDGQGARRAARPELLPENAGLAGCDRRVVEPARIGRDLIPTADRVEISPWPVPRTRGAVWRGLEARPESIAKTAGGFAREGREAQTEEENEERFHVGVPGGVLENCRWCARKS